jgi:hypothetical protein
MLMHQALHDKSITGIEYSKTVAMQEQTTALVGLNERLKRSQLPQQNLSAYI